MEEGDYKRAFDILQQLSARDKRNEENEKDKEKKESGRPKSTTPTNFLPPPLHPSWVPFDISCFLAFVVLLWFVLSFNACARVFSGTV